MMRALVIVVVLAIIGYLGFSFWNQYKGVYYANKPATGSIVDLIQKTVATPAPGQNNTTLPLKIPDGYSISIYAKDLGNPRDLTLDPSGTLVASLTSQGRVVAILGGQPETIAGGFTKPHGIVFNGDKLYVAETNQVSLFDYDAKDYKAFNKRKIIDLPAGGRHFTRSLLIKDGKLYVSIGSSCDTCIEKDQRYASVWWANLDGSDFKPYATGLRNSVFMTLNPKTNEIWATEMGRDFLGDDIPPDEVNIIKEGGFYGWPYCWGDGNPDKDFNKSGGSFDCGKSINPMVKLQAHSAPLGLAFLGNDLLVAFHGSWNRSIPTGYKIVRYHDGKLDDFITGFIQGGDVLGRPADILVKDTDIFISDDKTGVIYRLQRIP